MSGLDPAEVLAAAQAWIHVPPDAVEVPGDGFRLIAHPETWVESTVAAGIDSDRPAAEVVDAVLAAAAALRRSPVWFWTHPQTRPADLVDELRRRGAVVHEELAVLARPLGGPRGLIDLPDLAVPGDVEIHPADDLDTFRDAEGLAVAVFGGARSDDAALAQGLAHADLATGLSAVAYRDGEPVGTAGLTVADGVARLWGGAVLEHARGTGVYRALLDHRLRLGTEHGCRVALSKGRPATSAPVLRRAGFTTYGAETSYRLG